MENQIKHFNHPQLGRFSLQQMYQYSTLRDNSCLLVYLLMDEMGGQVLVWLDQHQSQGIRWLAMRHPRVFPVSAAGWSPYLPGEGQGKHCWEALYVIYNFSIHCAPDTPPVLYHLWRKKYTGGGQSPPSPVPPDFGQQYCYCVVSSTYPCRFRVGPGQRPCRTWPSARIHAGCPSLPGTPQRH